MVSITELISNQKDIKELFSNIGEKTNQLVTGIAGSARTLLSASLYKEKQKPIIWVTQNSFHAHQLANDLVNFVPEDRLFVFETNDVLHAEMSVASPEAQAERIQALNFLLSEEPGVVIVPLAGVRKLLPPKDTFQEAHIQLEMGGEVELEDLNQSLVEMGYIREQKVAKPGEFSIRGGIIDVYPLTEKNPVRIELFDIEVDSLRYFEADSQRSIKNIDEITIMPARDYILTKENQMQALKRFDKAFQDTLEKLVDEEEKEALQRNMTKVRNSLETGETNDDLIPFADFLYPERTSIMDYFPEDTIVLLDEYPRIVENNAQLNEEEAEWAASQLDNRNILIDQTFTKDAREEINSFTGDKIYFSLFQKGMGSLKFSALYNIQYRNMQQFFGQMPLVKTEMERFKKQGFTVIVMTPDMDRAEKVNQTLMDFGVHSVLEEPDEITEDRIQVIPETVRTGFELVSDKIAVLTEKELFNRINKKKPRRTRITNAERLKSYNELNPGDYVVHVHHGIGRYEGMETMEIGGINQDYLTVSYQGESKLFIPVTQLNLLQKYVSSEGKTPKINKLSGTSWRKTKQKVQNQVEDIADDLIDLYAERESKEGHAYEEDNAYQREFEEAFPYSETEDQLRSTKEVKQDLEKPKPMDRLLIGDVGYGKTEVAIRAIFKVVQEGKQVAFLVPTTVLAQQHYDILVERFEGFPVEISMLSRFRTKKQMDETKAGLKKGQVDIVVGTHRVLSKDVEFQDIGLLIVDEEQRFGVKHKERLKQLKSQVDVLTLTATPIPRTLHMSILGVRDLSVIETPPANRYPVQTYVMEMNAPVIKEAIEREMSRNGQIFFLHNRVNTIERRVSELEQIVPDARIGFAHGQMTETQLENVLFEFIQGEYDVLVTTTIIETGVDMPNVNTLIVEDADRMGLSQLYQLRGRVGRSSRIAYAYFMHQPDKILSEVSEKRLQAVKDFTELGSGFKIAMRDLAIRGAGNLIGKQQHGFIDSVGFDLYSQMLQEAVQRKRGDQTTQKTNVEIDLSINAYLPSSYITDERQKIELYKRIRQFSSDEDYVELQDELIDRFGEYPQDVSDLLTIGLIKMYSETALIETIKRDKKEIHVTFSNQGSRMLPLPEVFRALKDVPLKTDMDTEDKLTVDFKLTKRTSNNEWLDSLVLFAKNISNYRMEQMETEEDEEITEATQDVDNE